MHRRQFVKSWTSLGGLGLAGCQSRLSRVIPNDAISDDTGSSGQETQTVSGFVNTIAGAGVSGAEVIAYDSTPPNSPVELGRATTQTTGEDVGRYEFTVTSPSDRRPPSELAVLLVARRTATDPAGTEWFATRKINQFGNGEAFATPQDLVLNRQLLFGPTDTSAEGGGSYGSGVVTMWRWVNPENPREQILYLELVGAVPAVGGEFPTEPWKFDEATTTRWTEIDRAMFSVTLPEYLTVAYGREYGFGRPFDSHPTGTTVYEAVDRTATTRRRIQRWHPVREPRLPLFELDGFPEPGALGSYHPFAETELDSRAETRETNREIGSTLRNMMGATALSALTAGLGTGAALGIDLLYTAAEGHMWDISQQPTFHVGDEYGDPTAEVARPSPNDTDIVDSGWIGRRAAVAYQIPFRVGQAQVDADTTEIIGEAKWRSPTPRNATVRFGKRFNIRLSGTSEKIPSGNERDEPVGDPVIVDLECGFKAPLIYNPNDFSVMVTVDRPDGQETHTLGPGLGIHNVDIEANNRQEIAQAGTYVFTARTEDGETVLVNDQDQYSVDHQPCPERIDGS